MTSCSLGIKACPWCRLGAGRLGKGSWNSASKQELGELWVGLCGLGDHALTGLPPLVLSRDGVGLELCVAAGIHRDLATERVDEALGGCGEGLKALLGKPALGQRLDDGCALGR